MIASGTIAAVHVGRIAPLHGDGPLTAFIKSAVDGPVTVNRLGLDGDQQANLRVHGGPEKAVYGYPISGYAGWRADFPAMADRFIPGSMGENLAVADLDESGVHIGDVIRAGTTLLQVAQIREPCATLAAVLGTAKVARAMTRSGRCGWYYRVLETGTVAATDRHDVMERPNPGWPVARLARFATGRSGTVEALRELATLPGLADYWRTKASKALAAQAR